MNDIFKNIDKDRIPNHVAIIMDGNGRWAKKNGLLRAIGHKKGVDSVRSTVEASVELGISVLTLYAFSNENWNRPKAEINALMELLVSSLIKETSTFKKNNIQLFSIGEKHNLPNNCQKKLDHVIKETSQNNGLKLVIALSYSSKFEIINSIKNIAHKVANKTIKVDDINEAYFSNELYTANYPDPDLLIRTSGEYRISNFLLWQIAYTELYFSPKLWPDFNKNDFLNAIIEYQSRERRFGKTSEQIKN
ncbi:MAG: isoprenyl transferase [Flavobacteriales bacterium]